MFDAAAGGGAEVRLRDVRPGMPPVHILGRVVTAARRQITRRSDGGRRWLLSGLLSDGTATVRFTWWDPPTEDIPRGTVLRAVNVQVREFRGSPELSFGWQTRVAPASEKELPDLSNADFPRRVISDLEAGAEGFSLEARVLEVSPRTVAVGEESRVLYSGRLQDSSGILPFTAWVDFRLVAGEAVRILGGYIRTFRGRPSLSLDERSRLERIAGDGLPPTSSGGPPETQPIATVQARGGADDVQLEGLILGLVSPSGVVYRCPRCQRVLTKGLCREHGSVEGMPDLRARLVLDDGTGVATVNLGRVGTEALTGRGLTQYLERLKTQPDPAALEDELKEQLFGRRVRVRGGVRVDDFGVAVFPSEVESHAPDAAATVRELGRRLGGGLP
jgi:replication factor A1